MWCFMPIGGISGMYTSVFVFVCFRKHPIALVCDIKEMYLQVGITPPDRRYMRFLLNKEGEL